MKLTASIHILRIDFEITLGPGRTIPRFVNVILILGEKITLIDTGVKGSEKLALPLFLMTPVVDKAFRSHRV